MAIKDIINKMSQIVRETTKIISKDTVYGTRLGVAKVKELKYEQKKVSQLIDIGRKVYLLYKKGEELPSEVRELCRQMELLEYKASLYHRMADDYKKKIKL